MKKIFSFLLLVAFATLSFGQAKIAPKQGDERLIQMDKTNTAVYTPAQTPTRVPGMATIILDNTLDVWADGTGYQFLLNAVGSYTTNTQWACGNQAPYAAAQYLMPTGAGAQTSPSVIGTIATINVPAGNYSYIILNPGCNLNPATIYVAASGAAPTFVPGFASSYTFNAETEYRFKMQMNGNNDAVVLTVTPLSSDPSIAIAPSSLNFSGIMGGTFAAQTVAVTAYNLTAAITATTAAPFSVSSDNVTFASTATIAQTGGTLYVKYTPAAAGTHTGSISLASAGAPNATVALSGTAIDCSSIGLPLTVDFQTAGSYSCWNFLSMNAINGPGGSATYTMGIYSGVPDASNLFFLFSSYGTASDYNQYAVSPELPVSGNGLKLNFDYYTGNHAEVMRIGYSTTGNDLSTDFTWLTDKTYNSNAFTPDEALLPSGIKYIAFNYHSNWQYFLGLDNVVITELQGTDIAVMSIDAPATAGQNLTSTEQVKVTVKNLGATNVTDFVIHLIVDEGTPANETVSGVSIAPGATYQYTFAATADLSVIGAHTIKVTVDLAGDGNLSNNTLEKTVTNVDCSGVSFPYSENFENFSANITCWTFTNGATGLHIGLDPAASWFSNFGGHFLGFNDDAAGSSSNNNLYAILPNIDFSSEAALTLKFDYMFRVLTTDALSIEYTLDNGTTFSTLATLPATGSNNVVRDYEMNISALAGLSNARLAIHYNDDNKYAWGFGIDNIRIFAPADVDVILTSIPSPVTGYNLTATETVKVVVKNNGAIPITDLDFSLSVDEGTSIVESATGLNIAYNATYEYTFTAKADLSTVGMHSIKVIVDLLGDENEADNVIEKTVECKVSTGVMQGDFEDEVEDFAIEFPGWTQHNVDGSLVTWGWDGVSFPNSAYAGSYILFNPSTCVPSQTSVINAHSGSRFAACFQSAVGTTGLTSITNNDWLITPKYTLASDADVVSLWVAQLTNNYSGGEKFNVLISTTTTDVAAFTKLNTSNYETISGVTTWEHKTYDISAYAGQAVYIAVQCVSTDEFIFMVDDIVLPVASGTVTIDFEDVVSIYPNPSRDVVTINSPVAANVNVFDITGKLVNTFTLEANSNYQFKQSAGIYFLNINGETHKVVFE
jgi:hypothetical protein